MTTRAAYVAVLSMWRSDGYDGSHGGQDGGLHPERCGGRANGTVTGYPTRLEVTDDGHRRGVDPWAANRREEERRDIAEVFQGVTAA